MNKCRVGERRRLGYILVSSLSFYLFWDYFLCVRCYSPDIYSFQFCSVLNPDSSICMNCSYSPWFITKFGLRFVEYTIFNNEYLITDLGIIIDAPFILALILRSVSDCLCSPILYQPAMNGMSKSISCPNMAAPGEALSTVLNQVVAGKQTIRHIKKKGDFFD